MFVHPFIHSPYNAISIVNWIFWKNSVRKYLFFCSSSLVKIIDGSQQLFETLPPNHLPYKYLAAIFVTPACSRVRHRSSNFYVFVHLYVCPSVHPFICLSTIYLRSGIKVHFSEAVIAGSVQPCIGHSSMKSRSRAPGHTACLKSMSRTITMQVLTHPAITASEKCTLMLDS